METADLIVQSIAAVGSVLAAFASWQALKIARQANDVAERTANESAEHVRESNRLALEAAEQAEYHARESERREEMRDQRRIAGSMKAWWAINTNGNEEKWGVIISNTGPDTSVFYDVLVQCTNNRKPVEAPIATLPPGNYFLESKWDVDGSPMLEYPELVDQLRNFQPLLGARKHSIEELYYTDQLGQRWNWTREKGLTTV